MGTGRPPAPADRTGKSPAAAGPAQHIDVVVRFTRPDGSGRHEVCGTVLPATAAGEGLSFHGWLQLLGHLETLCTPSAAADRDTRSGAIGE